MECPLSEQPCCSAFLGAEKGGCGVAGTPPSLFPFSFLPSLYPISLPQAITNKLWLGFDLQAAIDAPILHVNDKGQVEYESNFNEVRPWSEPPIGWTPQCMLVKASGWLSATECLRPSTLQLWEPSGVKKLSGRSTRPVLWPPRQRTGCCPYFSQAEHLSTLVPAVSVLFSLQASFPGCGLSGSPH